MTGMVEQNDSGTAGQNDGNGGAELRGLPVVILRERSDRENLVDSEKI